MLRQGEWLVDGGGKEGFLADLPCKGLADKGADLRKFLMGGMLGRGMLGGVERFDPADCVRGVFARMIPDRGRGRDSADFFCVPFLLE